MNQPAETKPWTVDDCFAGRDFDFVLAIGDDWTDEHAFEALKGRGIGIFVGNPDDPEVAGRPTAADFVLDSTQEVERFLDTLAR